VNDAIRVRVPAKVNLRLAVGPLRPDGYHHLFTVFHAVGLHDEVTITQAEPGAGVTLRILGEGADSLPSGADNIAVRAAELAADLRERSLEAGVELLVVRAEGRVGDLRARSAGRTGHAEPPSLIRARAAVQPPQVPRSLLRRVSRPAGRGSSRSSRPACPSAA